MNIFEEYLTRENVENIRVLIGQHLLGKTLHLTVVSENPDIRPSTRVTQLIEDREPIVVDKFKRIAMLTVLTIKLVDTEDGEIELETILRGSNDGDVDEDYEAPLIIISETGAVTVQRMKGRFMTTYILDPVCDQPPLRDGED